MAEPIPNGDYFALYGSHSGPWRAMVRARLEAEGIASYDPTDTEAWRGVNDYNGHLYQDRINAIVATQWEGLRRAVGVIFLLDSGVVADGALVPKAFVAARFELGMLAVMDKPVFAFVSGRAEGYQYLMAQAPLHPQLRYHFSLDEAVTRAIEWFKESRSTTPDGPGDPGPQ